MRHLFNILFYIKKNQPLKSKQFSIICRISINGESCTFSTNLAVAPRLWDDTRKRVRGRSDAAKHTNHLLDNIRYALHEIYLEMLRSSDKPTPQDVRTAYFGSKEKIVGVISFFKKHNFEFEKMVGTTRRPNTLYKYRYVCNHLENFLRLTRHTADIPISKVDRDFICAFHNWLANDMKCSTNTIRIYLTAFKHILMLAIARGHITHNPFVGYHLHNKPVHRSFLMQEELRRLIALQPQNRNEAIILDAFIFSCFTGLSYSDIARLTMQDIIISDQQWHIATQRIKTHTSVNVPLLQLPVKIIKRYYKKDCCNPIFPIPTNCWCNKVLKVIAQRANIPKRITFHSARHTFATTVTLSYGVSIEAVSRMLGHTDIKTTQIYAKVLESVISAEMRRASDKINIYFDDYR